MPDFVFFVAVFEHIYGLQGFFVGFSRVEAFFKGIIFCNVLGCVHVSGDFYCLFNLFIRVNYEISRVFEVFVSCLESGYARRHFFIMCTDELQNACSEDCRRTISYVGGDFWGFAFKKPGSEVPEPCSGAGCKPCKNPETAVYCDHCVFGFVNAQLIHYIYGVYERLSVFFCIFELILRGRIFLKQLFFFCIAF